MVDRDNQDKNNYFVEVETAAKASIGRNANTDAGVVYLDYTEKLLSERLSDDALTTIREGWTDGENIQHNGTESTLLMNFEQWGVEATVKFIRAWHIYPVPEIIANHQFFSDFNSSSHDALRHTESAVVYSTGMLRNAIQDHNLFVALEIIDFMRKRGHYLLTAISCKQILDDEHMEIDAKKKSMLIKTIADMFATLSSWHTYNRYTSAAMLDYVPDEEEIL